MIDLLSNSNNNFYYKYLIKFLKLCFDFETEWILTFPNVNKNQDYL